MSSRNPPDLVARIAATGLLASEDCVLVMLSGGADSVCLLDVANQLCKRVEAMHVNYGLRDESDDDEQACRAFAAQRDLPLHVTTAELDGRENLHAQARRIRYEAAERLRSQRGLDIVAAGHTRDDQIETLLYRLASSPGRRALRGMAPRRGQLVRPLLGCTAAQIRDYLRNRGIAWREDKSNADPQFARARVRSELVPALRKIHPAAEQNLLDTARQLAEEGELVDSLVDELIGTAGAAGEIDIAVLRSVPGALARLALRDLVEQWAGRPVPVSREAVDQVLAAPAGSRQIDLPGIALLREYDILRPASDAAPENEPVSLSEPVSWGRWTVGTGDLPRSVNQQSSNAALYLERLVPHSDLRLRGRRPGDRIEPVGMSGSKTLQDLFVDRKVPRDQRASYPVVCSGDEIAWVPGLALSRRFAARPGEDPVAVWAAAPR